MYNTVLHAHKPFLLYLHSKHIIQCLTKNSLLPLTEGTKIDEKIPSSNAGAIAGGAVGGVAVILVIIVGILFLRYNCKCIITMFCQFFPSPYKIKSINNTATVKRSKN